MRFSLANFKDRAIYVIGGALRANKKRVCGSVNLLMLESHTFVEAASLNVPRSDSSSVAAGNQVYVFGGKNEAD